MIAAQDAAQPILANARAPTGVEVHAGASSAPAGNVAPAGRGITRKNMRRHKCRSGGDSEWFAWLPDAMLRSDAYRTLPHVARSVLVALAAQYNGTSNGSLSLTRRTAREYGIANTHTLGAALRELEVRGLIRQTRPGTRIPPRSAFFALGWRPIDEPLRHDPHDARPTMKAPDTWRTWEAITNRPHWTAPRRFSRWPKATLSDGARPHPNAIMGGARPPKSDDLPVAHGHYSNISGGGAA